jgi:hypothetical protein
MRCIAFGYAESEQDTTCSFYPRRFRESPWLSFSDPETDSQLLVHKHEDTITLCDADDAYEFDSLEGAIEHARGHLLSELEMQWRAHYGDELYDWLEMRHYLAEGWLRIIEELELMIVQVATIALSVRGRSDLSCASN